MSGPTDARSPAHPAFASKHKRRHIPWALGTDCPHSRLPTPGTATPAGGDITLRLHAYGRSPERQWLTQHQQVLPAGGERQVLSFRLPVAKPQQPRPRD
ncbi:hypothetical protein DACRYDRAFT_111208 [Dacryopinax primogenitus]|uniref:Uncharacterized protein n=1 Tax=Dacryopinax primogenitus (strain DJM 731) TaxID=1858805 RepID=M5FRF3_DACPD|nr:uncharacterized protein DACRYDRAFT_111208 [Dacryopinax primogenitus]EJT98238.1 hypothetical protein DACRYDRAFT_111208 [Dacryopinax primogenitus]